MNFIELAHDRVYWRPFLNTAVDIRRFHIWLKHYKMPKECAADSNVLPVPEASQFYQKLFLISFSKFLHSNSGRRLSDKQ
jgi:hypothetical protein